MPETWDDRVAKAAASLVKRGHVDPVVAVDCAGGRLGSGDMDQRWEIGSITKVLTSLLLAQLAQQGVVAVGDPITRWLPAGTRLASGLEQVTLEHLASHRSGLPRLPPGLGGFSLSRAHLVDPYAGIDDERLIAALAQTRLRGTPGKVGVHYSNFGAGILGHLLGIATGEGYEASLASEILEPLGLPHTSLDDEGLHQGRYRGKPVGPWHLASLAGAGGLRSTATDLLTLLGAVREGSGPLGPAIAETLRPRGKVGSTQVGLGWFMLGDGDLLMHDGGTLGARTEVRLERHSGTAVVVLGDGRRGTARAAAMLLDPRRR